MTISTLSINGAAPGLNPGPIVPGFPEPRSSLSLESENTMDQSCITMWSIIEACQEEPTNSIHDQGLHHVNKDCLCERDIVSSWISCHKCWDRITYHANQKRQLSSSPYFIDDVTLSLVQSLCDRGALASVVPGTESNAELSTHEDQSKESSNEEESEDDESNDEDSDDEESDAEESDDEESDNEETIEEESHEEESNDDETNEEESHNETSGEEESEDEASDENQLFGANAVAHGGIFGPPDCLLEEPGQKADLENVDLSVEDSYGASSLDHTQDESLSDHSAESNLDGIAETGATAPSTSSQTSNPFEDPVGVALGDDIKEENTANTLLTSVSLALMGLFAAWAM